MIYICMTRHKHNYQTVNAAAMKDGVSNHRIQFNLCDEEVIYGRYKTISKKVEAFKKQLIRSGVHTSR
jgi:hypothetical protein